MSAAERYARTLRVPHVARLTATGMLARLPISIDTLAIVLFARNETGSFGVAGLVAAAFGVGNGALTPLQGRLVDRRGHARVLLPLAVLHAVSLGALVVVGLAGAPTGALVACGFVAGASLPPTGAIVRQLLSELMAGTRELLPTVFAIDAIAVEMVFVGGPLITAIVVATLSPEAALVGAGILAVVGTLALVANPASRAWVPSPGGGQHHLLGALASPGLRTIVAYSAALGAAVGATEVTVIAFADDKGSSGTAGVLLALWALGSAFGGLVYGGHGHRMSARSALLRLAALYPVCSLPLVVAPSIPVMAALVLLTGCLLAPILTTTTELVGDVAPPGATTEAFTWPVMALLLGVALGAAVAGALIEASGWQAGFTAVVIAGACGAGIGLAGRATLPSAPRAAAAGAVTATISERAP